MTEPRSIAVVGAGLMGHGIAAICARDGHLVRLYDPFADTLAVVRDRIARSLTDMGTCKPDIATSIERINCTDSLQYAVENADFVFEAAPEQLALKQQVFNDIEAAVPEHAILASNTSAIPITKIMQGLASRHRAVGTHWWNPPHLIPLVEVIKTEWSGGVVARSMFDFLAQIGKTPVMVEKDAPGAIGNRLQHALWREAVSLVENGICDAAAVDTVIKSSFGRRLAVLGPLENADLIGTDLTLDIHENVLFDLEAKQAPSAMLERMVSDGKLGMKSGQGFHQWTDEESERVRTTVAHHLHALEKIL